jgi:hypothetical protein
MVASVGFVGVRTSIGPCGKQRQGYVSGWARKLGEVAFDQSGECQAILSMIDKRREEDVCQLL